MTGVISIYDDYIRIKQFGDISTINIKYIKCITISETLWLSYLNDEYDDYEYNIDLIENVKIIMNS